MLHYKSCGLDYVRLTNGYRVMRTTYGDASSVKEVEQCHHVIGLYLTENAIEIGPAELVFLRKDLDLSQAELGGLIGVGQSTLARWELGDRVMPKAALALIRLIYMERVRPHKRRIASIQEFLQKVNHPVSLERLVLSHDVVYGWKITKVK